VFRLSPIKIKGLNTK